MPLGSGRVLHIRLFIEHVEVPVIGAMVSGSEDSPVAAQIEVIPSDLVHRLLPRSKVDVFYLDYDEDFAAHPNDTPSATDNTLAQLSKGIGPDHYKLLFSGELFTIMYTKTGFGSRSAILQCLDFSNIWDTTFLPVLNYGQQQGENVIVQNKAAYYGLNQDAAAFDDIINSPSVVIASLAARGSALIPGTQTTAGLVGGLLGVLELLGGVPGKYVGVTAWHTVHEMMVRMGDQVVGDSGDTAQKLFDLSVFQNWLTNSLGQAGSVINFREVISIILRYIYYAVAPQMAPRYVPGNHEVPVWPPGLLEGTDGLHADFQPLFDKVLNLLKTEKGYNGSSLPLAYQTSGRRNAENTKSIQNRGGVTNEGSAHNYGFAADISITPGGVQFLNSQSPAKTVEAAQGLHQKALTIVAKNHIATPEELWLHLSSEEYTTLTNIVAFYKAYGEVVKEVPGVRWGGNFNKTDPVWALWGLGYDPVHIEMEGWKSHLPAGILNADALDSAELKAFYKDLSERAKLHTQVFRPDCWFVAPPACNLIFPEELSSFTYTRQMMREATRLRLLTFNTIIQGALLEQGYFAPTIDQVESIADGGFGTAAKAIVYPHEKFSGIIPKEERLSDASMYARLEEDHVITASETGDLKVEEQEGATAAGNKIDFWAARAAAFTFLSHRYAARTATASGRFMPRIVLGFPGLVVDRPVSRDPSASRNALNPTHFLGMIRSLSHSVTQAGGTTTISLSHVRSHKIGDDSDDLFATSVYGRKTTLAQQTDPGVEETTVVEVRVGMPQAEYAFALSLATGLENGLDPKSPPATMLGPKRKPVRSLTLERELILGKTDADATAVTVNGSLEGEEDNLRAFPFSKVTVVEAESNGFIPLEEAIRPPWFSEEYSNAEIGKLYERLFGCKSLIDVMGGLSDPKDGGLTPQEGYVQAGIYEAVEALVRDYTSQSDSGHSGSDFIVGKTSRVHASMRDLYGDSQNQGFHTYAAGKRENLDDLGLEQTLQSQLRAGDDNRVGPELDPRMERWERARDYAGELMRLSGFRG